MADLGPRLTRILTQLPVAELCDTIAAAGLPVAALSPVLTALGPVRISGPVVCLSGRAGPGPGLPIRAVDAAILPGAIVIVGQAGGPAPNRALVGGNMVTAWRGMGAAGLVIDGFLRDRAAFDGLPVWGRGVTPVNCRGLWHFTTVTDPIALPGLDGPVSVRPGDWLQADEDGAVVILGRHLAALVNAAEAVGRVEARMRDRIAAGEDRQRVYETEDRYAAVPRLG